MSANQETMTSRERVLKALNHEIPDRIPLDLGGNQTGIHKNAYLKLIRHLGIQDELNIMDAVQQLARPCEKVLERFHIDTRYIAAGAPADWKGGIVQTERNGVKWHDLTDEFGIRWSMPDSTPNYMDITLHPLADATLKDVRDYPWPRGDDPSRFAGLRDRALQLRRDTPYAVVSGISGVVYEFCVGRGAKYPLEFLKGWSGTLVCDGYGGYDKVMEEESRIGAGCLAHARRKFDELVKDNLSPVGTQAIQRIAALYQIERQVKGFSVEDRLAARQSGSKPLCEDLHAWLKLERQRVPEGSATAKAIAYSLNRWDALTAYLDNGAVQIDNNHIENLVRPWAMGRKAWLFAGSELAGQRAAVVMSLLQSAKLHGHDPWAYLKDVLTRLPSHLNSRIDELLPHRWQPG